MFDSDDRLPDSPARGDHRPPADVAAAASLDIESLAAGPGPPAADPADREQPRDELDAEWGEESGLELDDDAEPEELVDEGWLQGRRVAFVGKLGGVNRREVSKLIRAHGGLPVEVEHPELSLIVVGADELPLVDPDEFLNESARRAAAEGRLEIISETQFWQRLGQVEEPRHIRRLYTPAMLAQLLGVSVATIRCWHRRQLIVPAREVHRLPYFDFQEVASARRLAQLLATGASAAAIKRKLAALARYVPDVERPLAQLSIIVEGKQLLLRQGEGLIDPGGQRRIDFDALEHAAGEPPGGAAETVPLSMPLDADPEQLETPAEMLRYAAMLEDEGQLPAAVEMYRAALTSGGPRAEVCFQLAELLYRLGDVSAARERYYMAIELDEDYVEARANLGCVLAEVGQPDLAVAAFQGTLSLHYDYPDVHYHLARTLDDLGRSEEAQRHWEEFLRLAPDSPWADEAWQRLADVRDTEFEGNA